MKRKRRNAPKWLLPLAAGTLLALTAAAVLSVSEAGLAKADEAIAKADRIIAGHRKAASRDGAAAIRAAGDAKAAQPETERQTMWNGEDWDGRLNPTVGAVWHTDPKTGIEHKETYYSELVLPGDGLDIPGRWTDGEGLVRDCDGYIVVAADWDFIPYGETVETTLGTAKVYDTGCAYGTVDVYVNWE